MKKKIISVILIVVTTALLSGCGSSQKERAHYRIKAEYYDSGIFNVNEEIAVAFDGGETEVLMNAYPSAYRKDAAITPLKDGDGRGDFILYGVTFDGSPAVYTLEGTDKNLLKVKTDRQMNKGEMGTVGLEYSVILPESDERASKGEGRANLGNLFITLCAKVNGRPIVCEYGAMGDPFVSECADYEIDLVVPGDYVVASGFTAKSCDVDGDKTLYKYSQENVRDAAFVINDKFEIKEQKSGNRSITYCFYDDEKADETLTVICEALSYFESIFGKYPYDRLCVAQTDFDAGGMEYPCLCYVADDLLYEDYIFAAVHEIAHQWWYGIVGNDQTAESYLDESLTEYSAYLYFDEHPERGICAEEFVKGKREGCAACERALLSVYPEYTGKVARSLGEFRNNYDYVDAAYYKGFLMMKAAEDSIGRKNLIKRMKKYREKNEFSIATGEDFLSAMGSARGVITAYLNGKVFIPIA